MINCTIPLPNCITRLTNGITRLINGWGGRPGAQGRCPPTSDPADCTFFEYLFTGVFWCNYEAFVDVPIVVYMGRYFLIFLNVAP